MISITDETIQITDMNNVVFIPKKKIGYYTLNKSENKYIIIFYINNDKFFISLKNKDDVLYILECIDDTFNKNEFKKFWDYLDK